MKEKWSRANYSTVLSVLPNGNIRTHLDDYKKTSIAEGQYIPNKPDYNTGKHYKNNRNGKEVSY